MDGRLVLGALLVCACSANLHQGSGSGSNTINPDASSNIQVDAPPMTMADADQPLGMWTTPQQVPGASTTGANEDDCTLNAGGTELYFAVPDPAITGSPKQLWVMTRATRNDTWGLPQKLDATFNTPVTNESPRLSPDDLTIYFGRSGDIFSATRQTIGGAWSAPQRNAQVSTAGYEKWLATCAGGDFMVSRDNDLYEGTLGVDAGTLVSELSSAQSEISTFLSNDCLTVYFASNRSGTTQLYTSTRTALGAPWGAPTLVDTFGTANDNEDPWMSPDTRLFVFASVRGGGTTKDLYFSTR